MDSFCKLAYFDIEGRVELMRITPNESKLVVLTEDSIYIFNINHVVRRQIPLTDETHEVHEVLRQSCPSSVPIVYYDENNISVRLFDIDHNKVGGSIWKDQFNQATIVVDPRQLFCYIAQVKEKDNANESEFKENCDVEI